VIVPIDGLGQTAHVTVNGRQLANGPIFRYLGCDSLRVATKVPVDQSVNIDIAGK
jgi:hypothetical protein